MKPRFALIISFAAILMLAGCGKEVVAPEAAQTPPPAMPEVPRSHIRLRINLPLADLAATLNQRSDGQILSLHNQKVKCGIGHCRLSARFTRSAPLSVSGIAPDRLRLRLPFNGEARMKLPGLLSSLKAEAEGAGEIQIISRVGLAPSGNLQLQSSGRVRFRQNDFVLRVGGVQTNLAALWNANQDALSRPLVRTMDHEIVRHADTRGELTGLWRQCFQPVRILQEPAIWLSPEPKALAVGALSVRNGMLSLPVGMDFRAALRVQPDRPQVDVTPLPELETFQGTDNSYKIYLPLLLPYDRAEKLALKMMKAHPLNVSGMHLQIRTLKILPSGQDIIVRTEFCAVPRWDVLHLFSVCGIVFLRGVPEYDVAHREIRVRDLKYDLQSENVLLKVAHHLAGDDFVRMLEKECHFSLAQDLARLHQTLSREFSAGVGRGVVISGTVRRFDLLSLSWTKDGFVALLTASGSGRGDVRLPGNSADGRTGRAKI